MTKLKIHSGASKRFKKTGNSLKRKRSNKSHILTKRSTKNKRQLRGTVPISRSDKKKVSRMLKNKS
ncbi:MAG: 50S ribosomal protein L35 [SAR86 cluster bacterium]|jgi:large subunit ribosomal protein L35|nr:50S ribosomal protein L35 [SAR86 cluster bacterium]HIC27451.1 50S ribosomal protein L35 [Gammaproteobacteria bacterium]